MCRYLNIKICETQTEWSSGIDLDNHLICVRTYLNLVKDSQKWTDGVIDG